jgi:ABC-type transporter Mla subunit MlaD
MPLQDLTPQLRTRLNRMERAVGWFVLLATALLLFGFGYYIYKTAESKGWFKNRAKYFIFTENAKGLIIGGPVEFRGSTAGSITDIKPMPARGQGSEYNVYVEFEILDPNIGYIWTEGSKAKVTSADFLGKRVIEVTRGTAGYATYVNVPAQKLSLQELRGSSKLDNLRLGEDVLNGTNLQFKAWESLSATNTNNVVQGLATLGKTEIWVLDTTARKKKLTTIWNQKEHHYEPLTEKTKAYYLQNDEQPALTERAEKLVAQVEAALPGILDMTNRINAVLNNSANLTSNLNVVAENARPALTNLAEITANLRNPKGSLGEWLIPTNLNQRLDATLLNANTTLTNMDTNLVAVAEALTRSLDNLAGITSNLNHQVEVNSNVLSQISSIIVHTDEFVQGLKRHWLLRSAFKTPATNAPASTPRTREPVVSPKSSNRNP